MVPSSASLFRLVCVALFFLSFGCERAQSPQDDPETEEQTRANSQILNEIYRVVLLEEPQDLDEFRGWVASLNQGASIEGVYNGFVRSETYRKKEESSSKASKRMKDVFQEQLVWLSKGLQGGLVPAPRVPSTSRKLGEGVEVLEFSGNEAGFYTLKRQLGDVALRSLEERLGSENGAPSVSTWYSEWVVRTLSYGVDFGLSQRNSPDREFHRNWAETTKQANPDRLTWEVLNRVHRILNHFR